MSPPLTERQFAVLSLAADGKANKQIAAELHISEHTVRTFKRQIFRRLGAHNTAHAVALAFHQQLFSTVDRAAAEALREIDAALAAHEEEGATDEYDADYWDKLIMEMEC